MQIVIEIPEEDYECLVSSKAEYFNIYELAIKNGKPLPEYYGRLIDGDSLMQLCLNSKEKTVDCNDIARVPIIIPATEEGE